MTRLEQVMLAETAKNVYTATDFIKLHHLHGQALLEQRETDSIDWNVLDMSVLV